MSTFFAMLSISLLLITIRFRLWKRSVSTFVSTCTICLYIISLHFGLDADIAKAFLMFVNIVLIFRAIAKEEIDKFWHKRKVIA